MEKFDLDAAVKGQMDDLIGRLRAKRLGAEFPAPQQGDPEPAEDEAGDQAALESMLDGGE